MHGRLRLAIGSQSRSLGDWTGSAPDVGNKAKSETLLTEDEGKFLALLVRMQPTTAYQLSKAYALSPVSTFGRSKGKIYPIMDRLEAKGLLTRRKVEGDSRGTERLECTKRGLEAVRGWTMDVRPAHFLPDDPLRTRVQSFDLLSEQEQTDWVLRSRLGLLQKLEELEAYAQIAVVPFQEIVHDNAVRSVRMRLEWLDTLLASIAEH
jgi:DNA-binding PadR family transcriptional regulator